MSDKAQLLAPGDYRLKAVHLGSKIDLDAAAEKHGGVLAPSRTCLLLKEDKAIFFLFSFGSYVSISPTNEAPILDFYAFVSRPHGESQDDFQLVVCPEQPDKVEFAKVSINSSETEKLALVASLMAQSNTLEHYENQAIDLTESSSVLTDRMVKGKMPPQGKQMLVYTGKSLALRRELMAHVAVLDPPEAIWESSSLDRLYHSLRNNFEISQRMRVVEHKLELLKETAQLVVSINESRRSHFLEIIIILLIAVEIALYVVGH
jgi:uncharacterized Rmd1/YagE family protein